jgi:transposase-like protein
VGNSKKSKRGEAREFWETAVRIWSESGLSVREFCRREGLAEHSFYSWRRELRADGPASKNGQAASGDSGQLAVAGQRRRRGKKVAGDESEGNVSKPEEDVAAGFIELVSPTSNGTCCCVLELKNTAGAKMRVQLRSVSMPDLAAISRSFWNPAS